MIKSWICYTCFIITALVLSIFATSFATLTLLCLSVLTPLTAMLTNRLKSAKISIKIELPDTADKGSARVGKLMVANKSLFFHPVAKLDLIIRNALTGDVAKQEMVLSLLPKGKAVHDISIADDHCGKIVLEAENVRIYDVFMLTYKSAEAVTTGVTYVLPEIYATQLPFENSITDLYESFDHSPYERGSDLSEPFENREYAIGDNVKSIHWKLSQRLDKTIVRQGGKAIDRELLLMLNTCLADGENRPSSDELSKTAEIFISISKSLSDRNIAHVICFFEQENQKLFYYNVTSEKDWFDVVPKILSASFSADQESFTQCYEDSFLQDFEHIFCVSPCFLQHDSLNLTVLTPHDFY